MLRNLLYNCCPFDWNDEWRLNVDRLNQYAPVFTGKKLVIVREGDGLVPLGEVRKAFTFDVEFIPLPNDPVLCEVSGFIETLAKLESCNCKEATFYAHTKGVSQTKELIGAVRKWRDTMYDQCLKDPVRVTQLLDYHATAGCFRSKNSFPTLITTPIAWHYSGAFWWAKHSTLFSHPRWREVPQVRFGVEMYLGTLFPIESSACLYEDNLTRNLYNLTRNLYYLDPKPAPQMAKWWEQ